MLVLLFTHAAMLFGFFQGLSAARVVSTLFDVFSRCRGIR